MGELKVPPSRSSPRDAYGALDVKVVMFVQCGKDLAHSVSSSGLPPAVCGPSVSERLRVEPAVVLLSVFVHNTQTFAGGSVENVLSSRCLHSLAWSVRTRWDAN